MTDTTPAMLAMYRRMLMSRSGAERLKMGSEMFDAARTLARAGLAATGAADHEGEARARLFMRLYGADFDSRTAARIAERLSQR